MYRHIGGSVVPCLTTFKLGCSNKDLVVAVNDIIIPVGSKLHLYLRRLYHEPVSERRYDEEWLLNVRRQIFQAYSGREKEKYHKIVRK